jgi:hypothetical protein
MEAGPDHNCELTCSHKLTCLIYLIPRSQGNVRFNRYRCIFSATNDDCQRRFQRYFQPPGPGLDRPGLEQRHINGE